MLILNELCQLSFTTIDELKKAIELEDSFWTATTAPATFFEKPIREILDPQNSGWVTSLNIKRQLQFLITHLQNYHGLLQQLDTISADDINDSFENGRQLKEAVKKIGRSLNSERLSLEQLKENLQLFTENDLPLQGVINVEQLADEELASFVRDVCAAMAISPQSFSTNDLNNFEEAVKDYQAWKKSADYNPEILPLHEKTASAYQIYIKMKDKIVEFFNLCELKRFSDALEIQSDPCCKVSLNKNNAAVNNYLSDCPLTKLNHLKELRFNTDINPYYKDILIEFREKVLNEFLARPVKSLSFNDWNNVIDIFRPYESWLGSRPASKINALSEKTLRRFLDKGYFDKLRDVFEQQETIHQQLTSRKELLKLLILQKNIIGICRNFTSFTDLYSESKQSLFEQSRLIFNCRQYNLVFPVSDMENHLKVAQHSNLHLAYCQISNAAVQKIICVPLLSNRLTVFHKGLFYDASHERWEAQVIKTYSPQLYNFEDLQKFSIIVFLLILCSSLFIISQVLCSLAATIVFLLLLLASLLLPMQRKKNLAPLFEASDWTLSDRLQLCPIFKKKLTPDKLIPRQ